MFILKGIESHDHTSEKPSSDDETQQEEDEWEDEHEDKDDSEQEPVATTSQTAKRRLFDQSNLDMSDLCEPLEKTTLPPDDQGNLAKLHNNLLHSIMQYIYAFKLTH